MKLKQIATIGLLSLNLTAFAEEPTLGQKVDQQTNKASDAIKKTARKIDDKVCETVNGKIECAAKKVKHSIQNTTDSVATKATEIKNEVKAESKDHSKH